MASFSFQSLEKMYNDTMVHADPEIEPYFMMKSPFSVLAVIVVYLFIVWQGPKWMASHKPWNLKHVIIMYNFGLVLLSSYIALAAVHAVILVGNYSLKCNNVQAGDFARERSIKYYSLDIAWLFFISKVIELLDTIFFIIRKKNNQVTFLHVYHHTSMILFSWTVVKFLPKDSNISYPVVNCVVHIVMYAYYGLAALGPEMRPFLWWKKYITRLQIGQFFILIAQTVGIMIFDCPAPTAFLVIIACYIFTILLLFLNFYIRAYLHSPRSAKPGPVEKKDHPVINGHIPGNEESHKNGTSGRNGDNSRVVTKKLN